MKKVILFIVIIATTLSITSCAKDNDTPEEDQLEDNDSKVDQLVGKWKLIGKSIDGRESRLECDDFAETEFKTDNIYVIREFGLNDDGDCVLTGVIHNDGEWNRIDGNSYNIDHKYYELIFDGNQFTVVVDEGRGISEVYERQ